MAQVSPRAVVRCSFWHENGHDAFVTEPSKAVVVLQHLAQTEPELLFFVLVRDALDFGDEDGSFGLPSQVEVRLAPGGITTPGSPLPAAAPVHGSPGSSPADQANSGASTCG